MLDELARVERRVSTNSHRDCLAEIVAGQIQSQKAIGMPSEARSRISLFGARLF